MKKVQGLLLLALLPMSCDLAAETAPVLPVRVAIDAASPGTAIPKAFAGFSREWRRLPPPDAGPASQIHPAYARLVAHLCAFNEQPLCFRIGGNSADGLNRVVEQDHWLQYGELFRVTRTPLIINLNLARKNAALDADTIRAAQRFMPPGSIMTFELGNEPDGWKERYKPADYGFDQFQSDFHEVGAQLVPALTPGLAGPAWAHSAPPDIIAKFIERQKPLLNLITVHSYRFDPKSKPTVAKLLDDRATAGFAEKLREGTQLAHAAGLKLRLGECGSAWGGGIAGFSDTFAAALWTTDFMFELVAAGVDGVNFHGGGTSHYSAIRDVVQPGHSQVEVCAPYYGLLLFAEAVAHDARLLPVKSGDKKTSVKCWATRDRDGVVRVVLFNRHTSASAQVTIEAAGKSADVKRLMAPALDATHGIRFAGQTFDDSTDGNPLGALQVEKISRQETGFQVTLAPASAALLTIPAH